MELIMVGLGILRRWLIAIGPYAIVEVVLPGGTLIALGLYLYRRRQLAAAKNLTDDVDSATRRSTMGSPAAAAA